MSKASPRVEHKLDRKIWIVILDCPQKRNAVDAKTAFQLYQVRPKKMRKYGKFFLLPKYFF